MFFVATVLTTIYDTYKANRLKHNYMTYYIKVMRSHRTINVALTLRTFLTIQKHKGTMQLKPSCQVINYNLNIMFTFHYKLNGKYIFNKKIAGSEKCSPHVYCP